jgi:hypothetical protein
MLRRMLRLPAGCLFSNSQASMIEFQWQNLYFLRISGSFYRGPSAHGLDPWGKPGSLGPRHEPIVTGKVVPLHENSERSRNGSRLPPGKQLGIADVHLDLNSFARSHRPGFRLSGGFALPSHERLRQATPFLRSG